MSPVPSEQKGQGSAGVSPLAWIPAGVLAVGAVLCFHAAFREPRVAWLVVGYLACLIELRRLPTPRAAFYAGLGVGLGIYVPPMAFLGSVFGAAALVLWTILAAFHAGFVLLLHRIERIGGSLWALGLAPVVWCGLEYFRSEVWWLRFSWLSVGSIFIEGPQPWLRFLGVYGLGFVAASFAATGLMLFQPRLRRWGAVAGAGCLLVAVGVLMAGSSRSTVLKEDPQGVRMAGIQLEAPGVPEVLVALDALVQTDPEVELVQLSEYTFDGDIPSAVRSWCHRHRKWLLAGGRETLPDSGTASAPRWPALGLRTSGDSDRFFNTAFVVDPKGEVCFRQAKSRPIQFFRDGEPAPDQQLWVSPWGPLGVAICYDASYRRVMDVLVRKGAEGLLVPTMDLETWGRTEHELNARMARIRALEYGLPVFRVASSGISLVLDRDGTTLASAPFPGPGATLSASFPLRAGGGSVPWDALVAPACVGITGFLTLGLLIQSVALGRRPSREAPVANSLIPTSP